MMLYTKFPPKPITQGLMHQLGYGAVIAANPRKIYGFADGQYGSKPDFSAMDKQIKDAHGLPIHIHPILGRSRAAGGRDFPLLYGRIAELGLPVIEHCAEALDLAATPRVTISQELCLCKEELWDEIVDFYSLVATRYPEFELWVGDCMIRSQFDRDGILTRLEKLQGIATGFVGADHVDLSRGDNRFYRFLKVSALGLIGSRCFSYLGPFWKELQAMGFKVALETSAIAEEDTPLIRQAQRNMHTTLGDLCKKHGADYWWWNLCDESTKDFCNPNRKVYGGLFDERGDARLYAEMPELVGATEKT